MKKKAGIFDLILLVLFEIFIGLFLFFVFLPGETSISGNVVAGSFSNPESRSLLMLIFLGLLIPAVGITIIIARLNKKTK